jgi:hypothetical protein
MSAQMAVRSNYRRVFWDSPVPYRPSLSCILLYLINKEQYENMGDNNDWPFDHRFIPFGFYCTLKGMVSLPLLASGNPVMVIFA